jgi:hypothetical protein
LIRKVGNDLKGSGCRRITGALEIGVYNGSGVMKSPDSASKPNRVEEPGIERAHEIFCVEAKAQAGSIDLVMVAKASLRASERPFRVSGSGKMQP